MRNLDLGDLVEAHHGAVVAVAYAVTRDLSLAEDVAQETFVAAWGGRARLRDERRVRPWLCGIARNLARNALRTRRRERGETGGEVVDPAPSIVDRAQAREAEAQLHTALGEVPAEYREALVLFYWQERSIAEVARTLAISEAAAQKRLSRARAYMRDELERPLAAAGSRRKSAAAVAAAVMALIATRSGAARAAASTRGGAMSIGKGLVATATIGIVVGGIAIARDRAAHPSSTSVAGARLEHTHAAGAPPAMPPGFAAGSAADADGSMAAARGALPVPTGYQITVLGPTSVAVNLAGGASGAFLWEVPPAPAFERHVAGRVVDEAGRPVSGAVVVVGSRLDAQMGALFGAAAAKTTADGQFRVTTHDAAAGYAIALHPRGWSSIGIVPAGPDDVSLDLVAPGSGTLAIHTRQAGARRDATIRLAPAGGGWTMVLDTDSKGELRVPLLPAGTYRVDAWGAQLPGGGTSKPLVTDVTVTRGGTTELPLQLPVGTLIIAKVSKPGLETVEYFMYPGTETLDLAELKKRARAREIIDILLGGQDAGRAAELHDIQAGTYTLCVDAAGEHGHLPLACQQLDVHGDLLEVTVPL